MAKSKLWLYIFVFLTFGLLAFGSLLLCLGIVITNDPLLYTGITMIVLSFPFELGLVIYGAKKFICKNR